MRGIRVFDISDVKKPKLVTTVQTCRGSHTHTVVTQPGDNDNVYIYVSGTAGVRSAEELPGCQDGGIDDPNTARFRLEVIKVPLAAPETAAIVSSPRIFNELPVPPRNAERDAAGRGGAAGGARVRRRGRGCRRRGVPQVRRGRRAGRAGCGGAAGGGAAGRGPQGPPTGPNQCHDITVYPEIGLAGGACAGLGLLLDIRDAGASGASRLRRRREHVVLALGDVQQRRQEDPVHRRVGRRPAPRCRDTDKMEWGADALFTIENNKLKFHSYYKLPAPQTAQENCVAHNGSLIPIPGRDVMVQAWYQGGLSVFDWTDVDHPKEIAFFDRGPVDAERLAVGGSWSAYWYNGVIVSSEIARGLDIYELLPSPLPVGERDRGGEDREADVLEHAGPAEVRVAAELRARARLSRSARAIEGTRRGRDRLDADGADRGRAAVRRAAQDGADRDRHEAEGRPGRRPTRPR